MRRSDSFIFFAGASSMLSGLRGKAPGLRRGRGFPCMGNGSRRPVRCMSRSRHGSLDGGKGVAVVLPDVIQEKMQGFCRHRTARRSLCLSDSSAPPPNDGSVSNGLFHPLIRRAYDTWHRGALLIAAVVAGVANAMCRNEAGRTGCFRAAGVDGGRILRGR